MFTTSDNLELGNNKKAIQEADKVLKKTPNVQCARALKALALLRMGREEEAEPIMKVLVVEKPCDVSTLQVMTFYYRETDERKWSLVTLPNQINNTRFFFFCFSFNQCPVEQICTLYSNAVSVCPGNEELMSHLFMAYVRVNDYKQQQAVALQLYKFRPKNPYYFWAVMSIVLQALHGPDAKNKSKVQLLLALAQRMIDKLIQEDKLDAEQEVELYLNILKYQEKYEEALKFFDSDICKRLYPGAPVTIKIDLLKLLKRWTELFTLLQQLISDDHDRWDYYQEYITTCFKLIELKEIASSGETYEKVCCDFIKKMIEEDPKVRGPYLAQMELHNRMTEKELDANTLLGDYTELLLKYYERFGDRICCTYDLKKFLEYMEAHKRPGFASKLLQECGISSTTLPVSKNQMQRHIVALQISRICGAHAALSSEHLQALYTALSLHYEHGTSAFGTDLLATDIGPADPYALLAVNVMYDLAIRSQSSERLVEALCLLNYLLSNSPSNFHAKLLCMQLYHFVGCGYGAQQMLEALDVKHIQLDSMGYLHAAHLPAEGLFTTTHSVFESTQKFFTSAAKDTLEYLAMSYKFGSFSKLEEFQRFRERLSNSYHSALVTIESQLLEIVTFSGTFVQNLVAFRNLNLKPDDDRIAWNELSDNRDLTVVNRWDPAFPYTNEKGEVVEPEAMTNKLKALEKESFVQDIELLQLRSGLIRLVGSMYDLIIAPSSDDKDNAKEKLQYNYKILTMLKVYWVELFARIRQMNYKPTSSIFLVNLLSSRLHVVLQLPYEHYFATLADFVLKIWHSQKQAKERGNEVVANTHEVAELINKAITDHNNSKDLIWNLRKTQAQVVGCIEVSWSLT